MNKKIIEPAVYTPQNIGELLKLYRRFPQALIVGGGTNMTTMQLIYKKSLRQLILLSGCEDLHRISKTERYLELGSCVTLGELEELGNKVLPVALEFALRKIASEPIRNMATLGGHLAVKDQRQDLFPLFLAMDAVIEIRSPAVQQGRWITMGQLKNLLTRDDTSYVITRIRIPSQRWNYSFFKKTMADEPSKGSRLLFCALGNIDNEQITNFRMVIGIDGQRIIRDRPAEIVVEGSAIANLENLSGPVFRELQNSLTEESVTIQEKIAYLTELMLRDITDEYFEHIMKSV